MTSQLEKSFAMAWKKNFKPQQEQDDISGYYHLQNESSSPFTQ
jgi:hypothetical protein